jgi:hypothetical protein
VLERGGWCSRGRRGDQGCPVAVQDGLQLAHDRPPLRVVAPQREREKRDEDPLRDEPGEPPLRGGAPQPEGREDRLDAPRHPALQVREGGGERRGEGGCEGEGEIAGVGPIEGEQRVVDPVQLRDRLRRVRLRDGLLVGEELVEGAGRDPRTLGGGAAARRPALTVYT